MELKIQSILDYLQKYLIPYRGRYYTCKGAAWLRKDAAWLIQGCGVAQKGCGVAQTVARRLAVWQAGVRISARQSREGPLPSGSNEEIKSGTPRVLYITNIVCMLGKCKNK